MWHRDMSKHCWKNGTDRLFWCNSVQSLSCVQLFVTPWTAARQASLSITISQNLLKLISNEVVMPSNHLILCHPLLLLPSIFPSMRVFSNESVFRIRWPKYRSFSFGISPSNEYSDSGRKLFPRAPHLQTDHWQIVTCCHVWWLAWGKHGSLPRAGGTAVWKNKQGSVCKEVGNQQCLWKWCVSMAHLKHWDTHTSGENKHPSLLYVARSISILFHHGPI